MESKQPSKGPSGKRRRFRALRWIVLGVVVVLLVGVALLPSLLSSKGVQRLILAKINKSVGGQASFEDLSLGWFKGVEVADFRFRDEAGWASVSIDQIASRLRLGPLLRGNLTLGRTVIDKPRIEIDLRNRPAATQTQPAKQPPPAAGPKRTAVRMAAVPIVSDLIVRDGNVKITDTEGKSLEIARLNAELSVAAPSLATSLAVNMALVGGDKEAEIRVTGNAQPKKKDRWSLKGTSGDVTVEVNDLNLETLGPLFALAGLEIDARGQLSARLKGQVKDGQLEDLTAAVRGQGLDVSGEMLGEDRVRTSQLTVDAKIGRSNEVMKIDKLDVRTDWATVTATGRLPAGALSIEAMTQEGFDLQGRFAVELGPVLSQMRHTLGVKEGMEIQTGRLDGTIATTTVEDRTNVTGQASLSDLKGEVDGKEVKLSEPLRADFKMTSAAKKSRLEQLDVTSAFANVQASGDFEKIAYTGAVDLAKLESEFGQFVDLGPYTLAGQITLDGQAAIGDKRVTLVGAETLNNLHIASADGNSVSEPRIRCTYEVEINQALELALIRSLDVEASLGAVSVRNGAVPLAKGHNEELKLDVVASKVDLAKVQPYAVLFASFPKETSLGGTADSTLSLRGLAKGIRVTTEQTRIDKLKIESPPKKPFAQDEVTVVLDARIDPENKTIDVQKLEVLSPQIKVKKGQLKKVSDVDQTRVSGRVECEYDWQAVGQAAAPFMPEGLELAGTGRSTFAFESEYPTAEPNLALAHLNVEPAKIRFEKADYMGLHFGPTELDIRMDKGHLQLAPFETTVNEGKLRFAARADFNQKPTLLELTKPMVVAQNVRLNRETADRLLMYLNPIFANLMSVSGVATFECDRLAIPLAGGDRKMLTIVGTIWMDRLRVGASSLMGQLISLTGSRARDQDMRIRQTPFSVGKGKVRYENMQIDVGDNPLNFGGEIDLDGPLNMTVTLPYTIGGRTARVDEESRTPRIVLPLTGTIGQPNLDVERFLQLQLRDQIFKGIEGLLR